MSIYSDASQLKEMLQEIVDDMIEKNPIVKSAIKAKKATVVSVDTAKQTVKVQFPLDSKAVTLPYNPQMQSYLSQSDIVGKAVSVWYNQSINNGIVMQNGYWDVASQSSGENINANMPTISFAAGRTYNGGKPMTSSNPLILSVNILDGNLKAGDEITLLEPRLSTRKAVNAFHYRTHRLSTIARRTIRSDEVNTKNVAIALSLSTDAPEAIQPIISQDCKLDRILASNGLHYLRIRRAEINANGNKIYTFTNLVPIRITVRDNNLIIVKPQ